MVLGLGGDIISFQLLFICIRLSPHPNMHDDNDDYDEEYDNDEDNVHTNYECMMTCPSSPIYKKNGTVFNLNPCLEK